MHRRRDHGGVIFIDLRDREGWCRSSAIRIGADVFDAAEKVRSEYCLQSHGIVRKRPEGTVKPNLVSRRDRSAVPASSTILNASVTPPFQLDDENLSETTRLTHRVLDLRRPQMQKNLMLRYRGDDGSAQVSSTQHGFIDIETPMLTRIARRRARAITSCRRACTRSSFSRCRSRRSSSSSC